MMNYEYQYKHIPGLRCPECKETKEILYDTHHALIYCRTCGLILFVKKRENVW
ncbi:TPA_asm: hypothetical protein CBHJFHIM_00031 [Methanobrevibacter gottschalkii virus vir075]|uniref:TFIIB-type domain-containing protein n=1 Tax=Methanobrevibacter gottschalkii TaxID=190974 RepID=A0A1H7I7N8_9EURY|nr:hypothetical protein [Methanobrevibacter gottschalkii]SEK58374.1 hypothetical protein SAMN05216439_1164 [Methanobrevibacter gottschalkii]